METTRAMDRFESMSIFVTAVEAGSLSAAARLRGTPLATVSRKLSELETHLGTRLLNRSGRTMSLTDAGRSYLIDCKRILEDVGETERAVSGEYQAPKGALTVTAPIVFGRLRLLPIVADFLAAFPEINLRLLLSDRAVNLFEDQVDLALRIGHLPDSSLIAFRLGTIRLVVCASPHYFAMRGTPSTPADLSAHDCVTFESLMASDAWRFPDGRPNPSVAVHSRLVVNTAEAAIDAAIAGVGITRVLSYQVADALRAGTLAVALQDFEPEPWPVSFVHASGRLLPLKVRAFLDFATPRLRATLQQSAA